MSTAWLPALLTPDTHGGDRIRFLDEVYECFQRSFVASRPKLQGRPVGVHSLIGRDGRHEVFWHIVCGDRGTTPIRNRCAHMPWPRPVIEDVPSQRVLWWSERRGRSGRRTYLALPDFSFLIVLQDARDYSLVITAYPVDHANYRRGLAKRYAAAQEA